MPQLENGYSKIANEILEKLAKTKLNGTQFRILMIVWRSTYGWNKKQYELSLTYLAESTQMDKQQIKRELDKLIKLNIITVVKKSTYTQPRIIEFNKNYISKKITVVEKEDSTLNRLHTVSELEYSAVSELEYSAVSELEYQKRNIKINNKINNKRNIYTVIYDHYMSKENLVKHNSITDPMKKSIDKAMKQYNIGEEYLKKIIDRHSEKIEATKNNGMYAKKRRTLSELFGQKKKDSTDLILVDYLDENWTDKEVEHVENKIPESWWE